MSQLKLCFHWTIYQNVSLKRTFNTFHSTGLFLPLSIPAENVRKPLVFCFRGGERKKYLNRFSRLYWACRKVTTMDNLKNYLLRYRISFLFFSLVSLVLICFALWHFFSRTVITLKLVLGRYLPFFGIDCVTINSDVSWGMSSSHSGHSYLLLFSKKKECHIKQNCLKRFLL